MGLGVSVVGAPQCRPTRSCSWAICEKMYVGKFGGDSGSNNCGLAFFVGGFDFFKINKNSWYFSSFNNYQYFHGFDSHVKWVYIPILSQNIVSYHTLNYTNCDVGSFPLLFTYISSEDFFFLPRLYFLIFIYF